MADNLSISTVGGTIVVASDEINGVHAQRVKLVYGADGAIVGDVQEPNTVVPGPLPTSSFPATDYVMHSGIGCPPKFKIIDVASSGNNTIVASVAQKRIRVLALTMTMTGTSVDIRFQSGAGGTALTGQMKPLQGHTIVLPFNPVGWFETGVGELLNLELGGAQSVDGCLVYIEVG